MSEQEVRRIGFVMRVLAQTGFYLLLFLFARPALSSTYAKQDLALGLLLAGQAEIHEGISDRGGQKFSDFVDMPLARVYLEGQAAKALDVYVALDAKDTRLELTQLYAGIELGQSDYPTSGRTFLLLGRQPLPFALQGQSRPEDLLLGSSSMAASILAPSSTLEGVQLLYLDGGYTGQLGLFRDNQVLLSGQQQKPWQLSGRMAYRGKPVPGSTLQVGLSGSLKDIFAQTSWMEPESILDAGFENSGLASPLTLFQSVTNQVDSEQRGALDLIWTQGGNYPSTGKYVSADECC